MSVGVCVLLVCVCMCVRFSCDPTSVCSKSGSILVHAPWVAWDVRDGDGGGVCGLGGGGAGHALQDV